ncbi:MAG: hypothetical protein ABIF87_06735 [Pseudomonadota bacterium]
MEPERIYSELRSVAEKLGVVVSERNLKTTNPPTKSGICKTGGRYIVVIDKTEPFDGRIELLAACLNRMNLDNVYLTPAIRNILERKGEQFGDSGSGKPGI